MPKPNPTDYNEQFTRYIDQVPEDDFYVALKNQLPVLLEFLNSISEEASMHKYAPEKWTIKETLQHLIDGERVFTYRVMCIARKETAPLPSFDENSYAANSNANARSWKSLCEECLNLRRSTTDLINSLSPEMLEEKGISAGKPASVLSFLFVIIGHFYHHIKIVKERYLLLPA